MSTRNDDALLLLFVCSGNICRSPMAEALAAEEARRRGLTLRVASAGTVALAGEVAEARTRDVMAEIHMSLDEHRAQQISRELLDEATLVVALTDRHKLGLRALAPQRADRIVSFNDLTELGDVPDPFGGDIEEFRAVRDRIRAGIKSVVDAVAKG